MYNLRVRKAANYTDDGEWLRVSWGAEDNDTYCDDGSMVFEDDEVSIDMDEDRYRDTAPFYFKLYMQQNHIDDLMFDSIIGYQYVLDENDEDFIIY